jgi:hypothetical protein
LRRAGQPLPLRFFASGRAAPHFPSSDSPIHGLPPREFIMEIIRTSRCSRRTNTQ